MTPSKRINAWRPLHDKTVTSLHAKGWTIPQMCQKMFKSQKQVFDAHQRLKLTPHGWKPEPPKNSEFSKRADPPADRTQPPPNAPISVIALDQPGFWVLVVLLATLFVLWVKRK